ncbi:MAG TPA: S-adenosyl-l-methionine hydroxide adenosyltransferase family protein [Chitinophaga sp.]|uniref:SAM hydrolase/SAM-dependent halogenase family protein n=1 Tax=Chitinophaga sp. TaxID=1869181 RepID=UPI002BEB778E|nr:S-adenosyl-l-methionine hydroxide adenosyltransferase family protein [Chitinophaga sp.]HVI48638.1 S-adenosyl-l-methionine hydroxide adenosyltransferase family protein [Chitinophaga sp.]
MRKIAWMMIGVLLISHLLHSQNKVVVFQSDFGLKDGAVSAMKGVATGVSDKLKLYDLTHEIPAYNIWEAAYRLEQTVPYWPAGTVFVSVVDPGVGTSRKSVVLKTNSGHYIVTPDNGTLTLVAASLGVAELREIDEAVNRRKGSGKSYTFHGRDVYAYTAARLASGVITFEQVGAVLPKKVVTLPYQHATLEDNKLKGNIAILDVQYGNIWTNIDADLVSKLSLKYGDVLHADFFHNDQQIASVDAPYSETFGAVPEGKPLAYFNSLMQLSFALNMGNIAESYHIGSGSGWSVVVYRKGK